MQVGLRWQDATLADIYPLLCDVAGVASPEHDRAAAKRLVALGVLKEVDGDG